MNKVDRSIYVNDIGVSVSDNYIVDDNGTLLGSPVVIAGCLDISRNDVVYNNDYQEFTFNKNGKSISVNRDSIIHEGVPIGSGHIDSNSRKVIDIKTIVEAFGGTYSETKTEIIVSIM